jgi:CO/xanthine dehydrogenase FAD-binding subunit
MDDKQVWGEWRIDADAPLQAIVEQDECPPMLCDTLSGALSWQTRNETAVRRALASPRIAPQWVAALLVLGATVTVDGEEGPSQVALREVLAHAGGRVSALHVAPGSPGTRWGEAHVARTPADPPIVAAFATVVLADELVGSARVALTGVWPEPARLAAAPASLIGGALDAASIATVAEAVAVEVAPKGDYRGSEEYRRTMAGVLTRRALAQCLSWGE